MAKKKVIDSVRPIELTTDEKVAISISRKKSGMPRSFIKTYNRSRNSKSAAIKSMCSECCGYIRKMVRECPSYGCPLWTHRPYQTDDGDVENEIDSEVAVDDCESESEEINVITDVSNDQKEDINKRPSKAEILAILKG